MQRFVAAFISFCYNHAKLPEPWDCCNCRRKLHCFIRKLYDNLKKIANGTTKLEDFEGLNLNIYHFFPQVWFCNLKKTHENYKKIWFIEQKILKSDLKRELMRKDPSWEKLFDHVFASPAFHTSPDYLKQGIFAEIFGSHRLTAILRSIYADDYFVIKL